MKPFSEDFKEFIVSVGLGTFASLDPDEWGIFIGVMQDVPDSCIVLRDSGGPRPDSYFSSNIPPLLRCTLQVRCRSPKYIEGYEKLEEIRFAVHQQGVLFRQLITGCKYLDVQSISDILYVEQDEQKRHIWSTYFLGLREPLTVPPDLCPSP